MVPVVEPALRRPFELLAPGDRPALDEAVRVVAELGPAVAEHDARAPRRDVPDYVNHYLTLESAGSTIELAIFHDTYQLMPEEVRDALQKGARVEVDLVEREYKGDPQFVLENPFCLKVLP